MTDITSKASRGKVQIKPRKNGRYRLVITHVHEDQLELIKLALESARAESNTEYDAVALTNICVGYLST